jgi:hypothetical protein
MKKILISYGRMSSLCILLIVCLFLPCHSSGPETRLSSLNISMTLINQGTGYSKLLPAGSVEVAEQKVTLKEGDSLEKLLTSRGIFADGESIGVVYRLNPALDAEAIKAGADVVVPLVKDKKAFAGEFDRGGLVALTLDKEEKKEFIGILREFQAAAASVVNLQPEQFNSVAEKDAFAKTTKLIFDEMESFKVVLKERTRPLNSDVVVQMIGEAKLMNAILTDIVKLNRKVGKDDIEAAVLIAKDMDIRMKSLAEQKGLGQLPSRWPEVLVTVKTIDVQKGKEVNNMRVYYVPQALWKYRDTEAKSSDRLTSPADVVLPEADYYIWAGKLDDATPLTERKTLEVRKTTGNEKIELDLAVK